MTTKGLLALLRKGYELSSHVSFSGCRKFVLQHPTTFSELEVTSQTVLGLVDSHILTENSIGSCVVYYLADNHDA